MSEDSLFENTPEERVGLDRLAALGVDIETPLDEQSVAAQSVVALLVAAERVGALHRPIYVHEMCDDVSCDLEHERATCSICLNSDAEQVDYPCATFRALDSN